MKRTVHTWKGIELVIEPTVLPNNKQVDHTFLVHPGASVILPILACGRIVMVNQYRPSIKRWILELPAGTLDPNEDPLCAAVRELREETGYSSNDWASLGLLFPLAGFCDEEQHLFVANNVQHTNVIDLDEDELMEVKLMTLSEVETAIKQGDIVDSKTISVIFKAKLNGLLV